MSPRRLALVLALLASTPAVAAAAWDDGPPSLMFTPEQIEAVRAALAGRQGGDGGAVDITAEDGAAEKAPPPPDLHLSSLVYLSPDEWTAWVNGRPVTPGAATQHFLVDRVAPGRVDLILTEPAGKRVRLEPHQTYRRDIGAVVEGR